MIRFECVLLSLLLFFSGVDCAYAQGGSLPDYLQYSNSYKRKTVDYSIPHRTQKEILSWTNRNIANLLTFDANNSKKHFEDIERFFTEKGFGEFNSYVRSVKLNKVIIERNYSLNSIVDRYMFIKNHGPIQGIYRWVIEAPVLMSFYQINPKGYVNDKVSASAKVNVSISVTRVKDGGGEDKIAISSWKVTQRAIENTK